MRSWQNRLRKEFMDLSARIEGLTAFITGDDYRNMDNLDKLLLVTQLATMKPYLSVLEARVSLIK